MDDVGSDGYSADSATSVRTTASSAAKRTRKALFNKSKKVRKNEKRQGGSASSEEEENSPTEREKRKPGRPITTGEGVEILARKKAKKELQALKKEKENVEQILHGGYDPSNYKGGHRAEKMEKMEEMQNLPSRDIAAQMLEATKKVDMVANTSGNLKGTYVKILKEAMLKMTLGVDALVNRAYPKESENAREMERLREEIRNLREEMETPGTEGSGPNAASSTTA